jgi:hypothetical protein
MFEQLLEDVLSHDASECGVGYLLDELSDLLSIVAQFVDQFVGVDGAIVDDSFDLHGDVVLGDYLLRRHSEDIGLHVDLNHIFADGVDEVEPRLQDLHVPAEGLVDSQLGSLDLVDGTVATAAHAGAPDAQTASEHSATLQA